MAGLWHWLVTPQPWVPLRRCPICRREITDPRGFHARGDGGWMGRLPTYEQALIERCPAHGRRYGHDNSAGPGRRVRVQVRGRPR